MACANFTSMDPRRERTYPNVQYSCYGHYATPTFTPRIKSPCSEPYGSGSYSGWMSPAYSTSGTETSREGRGDPPFPDMAMRSCILPKFNGCELTKHRETLDRMQTRLKFLEDSNAVMHARTQNLVAENKALRTRLEDEVVKTVESQKKINALEQDIRDKENLSAERRNVQESGTWTEPVAKFDRPSQVWAVCRACQQKLENCANEYSAVTITKSELEILERDMQSLRDAVIAREEAWDKAVERERAYRQQLTRLTAEAITARHLSESRLEELRSAVDALTDRETELKSAQKDMLYANKIIIKLNKRLRDFEESTGNGVGSEMSEKEQKFIEDIVRRMSNAKGKRKGKSRTVPAKSQSSPREIKCPINGEDSSSCVPDTTR